MAIPGVGKNSLYELLCVLESAESNKSQAENESTPTVTEKNARIRGWARWSHTENTVNSDKSVQEQDDTEHGELPHTTYLASKGALGDSRNRETPHESGPKQDETEHGELPHPTYLGSKGALGDSRNRVTSDEHVPAQDAAEHGELANSTYLAAESALRQAEDRALSKRQSQKQDETEYDRIQADNDVLAEIQDVHDSPSNSAFQKAVWDTARHAIRAGLLQFESRDDLPSLIDGESEVVCSVSALGDLLREFASWARAETDAQTIGDAISHVVLGTETVEEWEAISEFSLNQAGHKFKHPYTILESWANLLTERERHIFDTRIAHLDVSTSLQDLGEFFGITRERARQLEKKLKTKLTEFVGGKEGKPIRWRAETVRQMIGVASPTIDRVDSATGEIPRTFSTQIENLLSPLPGQADFREVVLNLAGPYELIDGWLVLKSAVPTDPTRRIREMTDEVGYIDHDQATKELHRWGLDTSLHEEWLVRDGKIRKFSDRLVRWDGSIGDKLVIALADKGRPATVEALLEYIQEDRAKNSAVNSLSIDPRVVRISNKEWALTSWGLSEYSSIAMSIRHFLKDQEHPTSIRDVVTRLRKDLGLRESSVRAYCQAPMFVLENGAIRLRRDDEPYIYDKVSLQDAKGVFALGPHRVSLLFEVDGELLRGSGRSLALAAGLLLGVALNRPLTFHNEDGLSVTLTYPETSISGPSVGSLRPFAEASFAKLGDLLTLTLDTSDMSVTALATDLTQHESGWQLVSRLTGIGMDEGLEGLAASLQCEKGEVRALLRKRGDDLVKDALPNRPVSSELDQALASLEAQLQQTGGSLQ